MCVLCTFLCAVTARSTNKRRQQQLLAVNAELSTVVQFPSLAPDVECSALSGVFGQGDPTQQPAVRHQHGAKRKRTEVKCLKKFVGKQKIDQPFDVQTIAGRCPSSWRAKIFSGTTKEGDECVAQIAYRTCSCES
jgi:hypothetical protein